MANCALSEFITLNREDIIRRCRAKVATRSMPPPTEAEINHGVPLFLDQLVDALRLGLRSSPQIERSAVLHGHELLLQGFTVSQVVQRLWRRLSVRDRPGLRKERADQGGGLSHAEPMP